MPAKQIEVIQEEPEAAFDDDEDLALTKKKEREEFFIFKMEKFLAGMQLPETVPANCENIDEDECTSEFSSSHSGDDYLADLPDDWQSFAYHTEKSSAVDETKSFCATKIDSKQETVSSAADSFNPPPLVAANPLLRESSSSLLCKCLFFSPSQPQYRSRNEELVAVHSQYYSWKLFIR